MSKALLLFLCATSLFALEWHLPLALKNRQSWSEVKFTHIGHFGFYRKARPGIPAHLHTAIDLKRPSDNYVDEPIFAVTDGRVISFRDDGPFAQIIIEHVEEGDTLWSVYEHLGAVEVSLGQAVTAHTKIGRFMNQSQLERYGFHFDHIHLEIMKKHPPKRPPHEHQTSLKYGTYALVCYTKKELYENYYSPERFFTGKWKTELPL